MEITQIWLITERWAPDVVGCSRKDFGAPMQVVTERPTRIAFGPFEADLKSGELWRSGYRIKIQDQPFKVLRILLENAGEVVSREELQAQIWGPKVVVDFEHSLGSAIKKIRKALRDSASNPRFVETLSRRGYRFIAPVTVLEPENRSSAPASGLDLPAVAGGHELDQLLTREPAGKSGGSGAIPRFATAFICFLIGAGLTMASYRLHSPVSPEDVLAQISPITREGNVYFPSDAANKTLPASAIDGDRLFTTVLQNERVQLAQVYIPNGEAKLLGAPDSLAAPQITDISRDGTKLLVRAESTPEKQGPLWIVPVDGGSPSRLPNMEAGDAAWMPDGRAVLCALEKKLVIVPAEGGTPVTIANLPGPAHWLRWSPDGKTLRFTVLDPANHTSALWEMAAATHLLRPVLPAWSSQPNECCGVWTSNGRFFVFQVTRDGHANLWKLDAKSNFNPVQITNGPLRYEAPVANIQGSQIYFVGRSSKTELLRLDIVRNALVAQSDFLHQASQVVYSSDGRLVAWTDQGGVLWRARADGGDMIRLTRDSLDVTFAQWSPDEARLVLAARDKNHPALQLFLSSAEGGEQQRVLESGAHAEDASFSPDGRYLVYTLYSESGTESRLQMVHLGTMQRAEIAGSRGMSSSRWSPEGRYIAALAGNRKVVLYDTAAQRWKSPVDISATNLFWSANGRVLLIETVADETWSVFALTIADGRLQQLVSRKQFPTSYKLAGRSPDDVLLVHAETQIANLYTMDLGPK